MKLTRLELSAARMIDSDGNQWLRLLPDGDSWVWYRPTDGGFTLTTDEKAVELELAYRETLS